MQVFTVFEILATSAVPSQKPEKGAKSSPFILCRVGPPFHSSVEGNAEKKIEYFGNFVFRGV